MMNRLVVPPVVVLVFPLDVELHHAATSNA